MKGYNSLVFPAQLDFQYATKLKEAFGRRPHKETSHVAPGTLKVHLHTARRRTSRKPECLDAPTGGTSRCGVFRPSPVGGGVAIKGFPPEPKESDF